MSVKFIFINSQTKEVLHEDTFGSKSSMPPLFIDSNVTINDYMYRVYRNGIDSKIVVKNTIAQYIYTIECTP